MRFPHCSPLSEAGQAFTAIRNQHAGQRDNRRTHMSCPAVLLQVGQRFPRLSREKAKPSGSAFSRIDQGAKRIAITIF